MGQREKGVYNNVLHNILSFGMSINKGTPKGGREGLDFVTNCYMEVGGLKPCFT